MSASEPGARVQRFVTSAMFERMFREGMALVEETAAYLDGPGRAASRALPRQAALAYTGESMRLTTKLMQVASWLMVQRALREGELTAEEAREDKYRLTTRPEVAPFATAEAIPPELAALLARAEALHTRVRRLDGELYDGASDPQGLSAQLSRLRTALGAADE